MVGHPLIFLVDCSTHIERETQQSSNDGEQSVEVLSQAVYSPWQSTGTGLFRRNINAGVLERTCNESLVELYYACFSDELSKFRLDFPENKLGGHEANLVRAAVVQKQLQGRQGIAYKY